VRSSRATTDPLWTRFVTVGKRTRVTLPLSKDKVIFGVRAVDTQGNRSRAVSPTPVL
jgi:hypothetical protein